MQDSMPRAFYASFFSPLDYLPTQGSSARGYISSMDKKSGYNRDFCDSHQRRDYFALGRVGMLKKLSVSVAHRRSFRQWLHSPTMRFC